MTDPNPANHWNSLAADLGVRVPDEEVVSHEPAPPSSRAVPPPPPRAAPPSRPAPAPVAAANWDALASDLGLAPAPPPVAAKPVAVEPVAAEPPPSASAPSPSAAKRDRRDAPAPETAEESPNFFDERFDFEEPFDLLEPSEAAPPPPAAETTEPTEKRPRKRHRGRRSGKKSERKESHEPAAVEEIEVPSTEALPPADDSDRVSTIVAAEGIGVEEVKGEPSETAERRPKRHRGRRGRKKRPGEEAKPVAAGEPVSEESSSRPSPSHEEDSFRPDRDEPEEERMEAEEEGEDEGDRPTRMGFRGIPTWEEAVGLVIAKNLEARSKRPGGGNGGGGSHQKRGGGGRGPREKRGGRGGRRRS
jgi:hypothetical protein